MDTLKIDVMINGGTTFYKAVKYDYCPLFKFDLDAMLSWLVDKLPSLKTRKDAVLFLSFPNGEELECKITNKKR